MCANRSRLGMTIVEALAAIAIMGVVAAILAQSAVWILQGEVRARAHQAALELAANTLEAARAQPWERLDETWAKGQVIPDEMKDLLPQGTLAVTVEKETDPLLRRVTVEVRWELESYRPADSVRLVSAFSGRDLKKEEQKP